MDVWLLCRTFLKALTLARHAGESIRLKGKNLTESEHVRLGAYHTLDIGPQQALTIEKEAWDTVDLDRVQMAADPAASADLAVLLITDGLANLSLVGANATVHRARVEVNLPRKKGAAAAGRDKAVESYYNRVFMTVSRHVDWGVVKCLVIAGPGFVKDQFLQWLMAEAQRREDKPLLASKTKIITAPASTAFQHSLKEVLAVPAIATRIRVRVCTYKYTCRRACLRVSAHSPSKEWSIARPTMMPTVKLICSCSHSFQLLISIVGHQSGQGGGGNGGFLRDDGE